MSYRDWNEYADLLASALSGRGIGADDVIALRARVRMEGVIVSAAVAKIDARLVVIDASASPRDVRNILTDSGAVAVICDDEDLARLAPALDGLSLRLTASISEPIGGFYSFWDLFPPCAPRLYARSRPPMVFYPVGSSEKPRGVATTRRLVAPASRSRPPIAEDGATLIAGRPPGLSVAELAGVAIGAGRRLVLIDAFKPAATLRAIEQHGVTHWIASPAQVRRLMALPAGLIARFDLSSLKSLSVEAAPAAADMQAWIEATFGPVLAQTYDCPETGPVASVNADLAARKPGAAGYPLAGVEIEVRGTDGQTAAPGETGEIWARTSTQIERYFGVDPFAPPLGDARGFFRIGDAGWRDADGCLFVTGRTLEFASPIGGHALADIEAALKSHPDVMAAVVLAPADDGGAPIVFCETWYGRRATVEALCAHLRSRFPARAPERVQG